MASALSRWPLGKLPGGLIESLRHANVLTARTLVVGLQHNRRSYATEHLSDRGDGRERVVILGSGWAGFTFARRLDPKNYRSIVIFPRSYFVFTPLLASCSVGTLEFRTALEPIRNRRSAVEFFQGWADSVDFAKKTITVEEAVDDPRQGRDISRF